MDRIWQSDKVTAACISPVIAGHTGIGAFPHSKSLDFTTPTEGKMRCCSWTPGYDGEPREFA
jgi:hypothetical protein